MEAQYYLVQRLIVSLKESTCISTRSTWNSIYQYKLYVSPVIVPYGICTQELFSN